MGLARHKRRTFLSGVVGLRGTLPWMAPEVVKTPGAVDERADVFAFGVVMWELWTCKIPHQGLDEYAILGGLMNHGLRPAIPDTKPPHPCWSSLMEACWDEKPSLRPNFALVLEMLESWKEELRAGLDVNKTR